MQDLKRQMSRHLSYNRSTFKRPCPSDAERSSKRRSVTVSTASSTVKYTAIAGHRIACFVVGGEPRLCLPQLLRLIVDLVDVGQVESTRRRLSVNLAECDAEQLTALRDAGVLPPSVSSCGLVTLSDAARLVSGLSEFLFRRDEVVDPDRKWAWLTYDRVIDNDRKCVWSPSAVDDVTDRKWAWSQSASDDVIDRDRKRSSSDYCDVLPVCHSCFGGCGGTLSRRGNDIRCDECSSVLSPKVFVTHTHRLDAESRATCHWGFDSDNWRHYVMLNPTAVTSPEVNRRLQAALDDVKQLRDDQFPVKLISGCHLVKTLYSAKIVRYVIVWSEGLPIRPKQSCHAVPGFLYQ